jgi:thioredoxin-related protein
MNKLFNLLLLPAMLLAVEWRSWEQGSVEAEKTQKPLLVAFVRDGCHYCHAMEQNVFDDAAMGRWVSTCFVPVKVNLSERKPPFAARIPMTPTFVILKPDGTIIKTVPGSWNIPDFKALVSPACPKE